MVEAEIPEDHPRHDSLVTRHRIEAGVEKGITSRQGLIAQGRGEAFDYLLGERTLPSADAAALVPAELVALADAAGADLEVNLFNRTDERMRAIADHLRDHGATAVKGLAADARIPNLDHERAKVDADGIADADVVLVPLEDGDRAAALADLGKVEIVIDLNPLSRSSRVADVPIVDNILRAIPAITAHARDLADADRATLERIVADFDPEATLDAAERTIREGDLDESADRPSRVG